MDLRSHSPRDLENNLEEDPMIRPPCLRRGILPMGVFSLTLIAHLAWVSLFPEVLPKQARWAPPPRMPSSILTDYLDAGHHWLGLSYAISFTFVACAFRRYREEQSCVSGKITIAGLSISGFLAMASCFLIGCCGSPMLAVYLNLLGAQFLPLARPFLTLVTALSCIAAWYWLEARLRCDSSSPVRGSICTQEPPQG